jgi:aminoglycoside phosphotransferase (APT) family kinase protein
VNDAQVEFFRERGAGQIELIGRGMEGAVYDLGDGLVGKVWLVRRPAELHGLRAFHQELSAQQLPFCTPEISEVFELGGQAVSIEPKLPGTPLRTAMAAGVVTEEQALDAFASVVSALAMTVVGQPTKALPVLDEHTSLWEERSSWGEALAAVVRRRGRRSILGRTIDGFDALLERLVASLGQLPPGQLQLVHGDICPPNLLVDTEGQVSALLDWGFFTTAGDNAFDAATAAGFYDMYGPGARAADDLLLNRFESELGYSRELMLLYRAAYAVSTATMYSPDGGDGHFAWCAAHLTRADLRSALQ